MGQTSGPPFSPLGIWLDFRTAGQPQLGDYEAFLRLATDADALGFGLVLASEHHAEPDGYLPAPHMALAAIAARTTQIRLGAGLALAPPRRLRALIEEVNVLDQLSSGRAIAGFGLGYSERDFAAFGADRSRRGRIFDHQLTAAEAVWKRGEELDGLPVTPAPLQPGGPPLMLGGWARPALARAARHADLFMAAVGPGEPYRSVTRTVRRLREACAPASTPPVVFGTHLWILDSPREWEQELGPAIARQRDRYCELAGMPVPLPAPRPGDYIIGDSEQVLDAVRSLLVDGVDAVVFWARPPGVGQAAALANLERVASEVLPRLGEFELTRRSNCG